MAMSNENWAEVERRLANLYDVVVLDCDGYRLALYLGRRSTYKNAIMFQVDGRFRVRWYCEDCEERRRFFRPVVRRVHKKDAFKGISKKMLKALGIDPNRTITHYTDDWTNFASLRRHLIKNNKEISLIRNDAAQAKEAACG